MTSADLLSTWATLSPLERLAVREVYFRHRSVGETAARLRVGVLEVSRALHSAYRRVAAFVLEAGGEVETPTVDGAVRAALAALAEVPVAGWRWDTAREEMTWTAGLFDLYGYPPDAVEPTIGLHQAHKQVDDRAAVERLVLTSATEHGPVVFPHRIVRTDGTVCRVVVHVVREPGPGEVLTGRVVAGASLL